MKILRAAAEAFKSPGGLSFVLASSPGDGIMGGANVQATVNADQTRPKMGREL
jgi:hypothetical protein